MNKIPRRTFLASALLMPTVGFIGSASAQSRSSTLRVVLGGSINTLNPMMLGATREATNFSFCTYDRLIAFGRKQTAQGWVFDFDKMRPELAESFEVTDGGKTIVFNLRKDATWHDGSPVTAEDIKWSLDRAVSASGMAKAQIATGSLVKPDQFTILDPRRVRVALEKPDRLALANLCSMYAPMYQSKKAKEHATTADPWANEWLKENVAGSGAYMVERFRAGEQIFLRRNDRWKGGADGKPASFERVIVQTVPEAATRANLMERGDADFCIDLGPNDVAALGNKGSVKVVATPLPTGMAVIAMNTRMPPFDNKLVRQAIVAATPYDDLLKGAIFNRAVPLFGADWSGTPPTGTFPQRLPNRYDLDLAKSKLAQAGLGSGFRTSLSYAVGGAPVGDPLAALLQESLAKIGVQLEIRKLPEAQMAAAITDKSLPMLFEGGAGAMFPSTDYGARIYLNGPQRWNYPSWNDPRMASLIERARFETSAEKYEALTREMVALIVDEAPMVFLWQPFINAVMAHSIDGYTLRETRLADLRDLRRV